jgi:putative addiction module component (TIGR02574 family)
MTGIFFRKKFTVLHNLQKSNLAKLSLLVTVDSKKCRRVARILLRIKIMTAVAERIFKDALELHPAERAELIEKLFQSFDDAAGNAVDAAWAEEVESRLEAYDRGEIKASSAEDVFARINQR